MTLAGRWRASPYDYARAHRVAAELSLSHATASILVRRGFDTPEAARRFLSAGDSHDPAAFAGIDAACELILDHVARGSKVVIHGDYDVDGVCSTATLARALRRLGAEARWHLPERSEGYGLTSQTVQRLAAEGCGLLLTVDCGITAVEEVAEARRLGVDVVVTDHHRPADDLPDCPIVHPTVCGYPCEHLCATGVALKLSERLLGLAGRDPASPDHDLVALATIADVVPLVDENRRLVREGLAALSRTSKPGLRALMEIAAVDPGRVDEHAVGFRLAPRLNAAGRLARADAALELLLCEDEARAAQIADELDLLNRERQDTETRILFAAEAARAEHPDLPVCVVAGEGWHPGVIGIVAGRLVERYHRPCVVIALDGERGRGSGRSIPAYDLHAGLAASAAHLLRFGGHRAAAGLELERKRVDDFRGALAEHAGAVLAPEDLVPVERVDCVISADAVGVPLAEEFERLGPFGHGNPRPTLLVPAARVDEVRAMGDEGQHARFTICGGGGRARAVAFRTPARSLLAGEDGRRDAAVRLELNEWRGAVEPRLVLRALCPTPGGDVPILGEGDFWGDFDREYARELPIDFDGTGREPAGPRRAVIDRRGSGFAGVVGDLRSSGERVLIVCAESARRSGALGRIVAGGDEIALTSWDALEANPAIGADFEHLVALDPPLSSAGLVLLGHPCSRVTPGFAHLAWGVAEIDFSGWVARQSLGLRPELEALYRELRPAAPCRGEALETALRGPAAIPRSGSLAARLVRVLCELRLVAYEDSAVRLLDARRTELELSPTYVFCRERLEAAEAFLEGERRRTEGAPALASPRAA